MSDLGLASGTVRLVPYNKNWPRLYALEVKKIQNVLGLPNDSLQHIGSTSIPGMIAKPILDIAILVDSLEIAETWKDRLAQLDYWYKGIESDLPNRRFFAKGPRSKRTVYIHVVNQNEYDSLIKFRDALRNNAQLAKEYSDLKQELAATHVKDRDTYTRSKNNFIHWVLSSN